MSAVNSDRRTRLMLLIVVLVVLLATTYGLTRLIFGRRSDVSRVARDVDSIVSETLTAMDVNPLDIQKNFVKKQSANLNWEQVEILITLDKSESMSTLNKGLQAALNLPQLTITEEEQHLDSSFEEHQFSVYLDNLPIYQILLRKERMPPSPQYESLDDESGKATPADEQPKQERPRIALVIDDVGYDLDRAMELLRINHPMTISIFPKLKHSRHIAEVAHEMGYEIMMHLPMESSEALRRNPGFITQEMNDEELHWVLDKDFESIPYIAGVNNHQGSKMTGDPVAMARVMQYLSEKDVFFIDSRTTRDSVAYEVAKRFGLRAAENGLFLDNEKNPEYIKGQIRLLIQEAERKGSVIGICHVHPVTIQTLQEVLPTMEEQGIELVYASQLVN